MSWPCWSCGLDFVSPRARANHETPRKGPLTACAPTVEVRAARTRERTRRAVDARKASGYFTPWRQFVLNSNERARTFGTTDRLTFADELPLGPCFYCGGAADSWDHVAPLSKGGPNRITNLVSACRPCNDRKGDRPAGSIDFAQPVWVMLRCAWCWGEVRRSLAQLITIERKRPGEHYVTCGIQCRRLARSWVMKTWRPSYSLGAARA